jgi:hypothetical protein
LVLDAALKRRSSTVSLAFVTGLYLKSVVGGDCADRFHIPIVLFRGACATVEERPFQGRVRER